jgi:hypothetical protein
MLRRAIIVLSLFMLLTNVSCKSEESKPDKISRINVLTTKAEGDRVEFASWILNVEGDKDLGIELHMADSSNSYPQAFVTLKEGQSLPQKERIACVSGLIVKREEMGEGNFFRIKEAELIECY